MGGARSAMRLTATVWAIVSTVFNFVFASARAGKQRETVCSDGRACAAARDVAPPKTCRRRAGFTLSRALPTQGKGPKEKETAGPFVWAHMLDYVEKCNPFRSRVAWGRLIGG